MLTRIVILLGLIFMAVLGYVVGYGVSEQRAVCHGKGEDHSIILDCNFRDGGWYRK